MKNAIRFFTAVILVFAFTLGFTADDKVQAKIGIMHKSGNKVTKLKSNDRAKAGDEVRIFIQPMETAYVYVIYSDGNEAMLLNYPKDLRKVNKDHMLILPSETEFYAFDDQSPDAYFSIMCSETKIEKLEDLYKNSSTTPHNNWTVVAEELETEVKSDLASDTEKPLTMAGNVRGLNDDFSKKLPVFTDDQLILRKYSLEIK